MRIFLLLLFFLSTYAQVIEIPINTTRGLLIGRHFDQGNDTTQLFFGQADLFLGIPFAKPPVGALRFEKPARLDKYPRDPYYATEPNVECPQPDGRYDPNVMNEDCLYLNIITPAWAFNSSTKYPVIVWIHGGGFTEGSGLPSIPGTVRNFIMRGVIVVLIQYRLGALGFFTTFTDDIPANLGLLDQVEALKYVQEEIGFFGGDPTRVTLAGESAGAHSVSAHTYSPLSQDLYAQAIMESGTTYLCYENLLGPTHRNLFFTERACNFTYEDWQAGNKFAALKNCLQWHLDVPHILSAQQGAGGRAFNSLCYNMVQDNYFFPGVPRDLYKQRKINKPTILGTNKDEWGTFEIIFIMNGGAKIENYTRAFSEWRLTEILAEFFGAQAPNILPQLEQMYFNGNIPSDDDHLAWLEYITKVGTTAFFTGPAGREIGFHLDKNNTNVYLYEFTYYSNADQHNTVPGWNPVTHGVETSFLFMGWSAADLATHRITEADVNIALLLGESWTNFAKFGKPSLNGSWPAVTTTGNGTEYFHIGNQSMAMKGYRPLDRLVFNQFLPSILGDYPPDFQDYNNGSVPQGCPFTWMTSKVSPYPWQCYGLYNSTKNQSDATNYCQQFYGDRLMSVDSAFQNNELLNYLKSTNSGCQNAYLGLYKHGNGWLWNNGDNTTYTNWASGYPTSDASATCVVINLSTGKWMNQACTIPTCYVCKQTYK